jgi:hypothetical protein
MRNVVTSFAAGFLATLGFHQPVLWALNAAGIVNRAPYAMDPTKPFGVPAVISLAFWGGVWGIALWLVLRGRATRASYWLTALLFGAVAPTLVAGFVVAPLKGQAVPADQRVKMLTIGLLVNAAWGIGTALLIAVFNRRRVASGETR